MIRRLDIKNFGSFSEFSWEASVTERGTVSEFARLNILFGRNYSGKTTLSRILRSFEVGKMPENYQDPDFEVAFGSRTLAREHIGSHPLDIRVYNTDFVNENLSFLVDSAEGGIKPFAIIGSKNRKIEERIREIEKELGDVERKTGKKYELDQKGQEYRHRKEEAEKAGNDLDERLRRYANGVIKHDPTYRDPNYNITSIRNDIKTVRGKAVVILGDSQVTRKKEVLREEPLADIGTTLSFRPGFKTLCEDSAKILTKGIKPSEPIQELLNDSLLQSWVRSGMDLHRNERSACGFCGQTLPSDIWGRLDAHFSEESLSLEDGIKKQIEEVESEINSLSEIRLPEKQSFYASVRPSFEEVKDEFLKALSAYREESEKLLGELRARQKDIFKPRRYPVSRDFSDQVNKWVGELNNVIGQNNERTKSLSEDQGKARGELRLNAVADFIRKIDLDAEERKVAAIGNDVGEIKKALDLLAQSVNRLEEEKDGLQTELRDEKKGAEKVNEYLNHFFGVDGLSLVAEEDAAESRYKFRIMRGRRPAYNMSEGERSLVSFCYFMAKLEDAETQGKDLIVYIDDPVSSLDSNHIFFVFSLIESVLAKPEKNPDGSNRYGYRQLFISTHNLDFLKYLKRLSAPKENHGGTEFFLVEKEGFSSSLRLMPRYLKDYQTEFIYLFHQIYKCRDAKASEDNHQIFYNLGNNLRKFLEAYLFYKYPYTEDRNDRLERLRKFFGNDVAVTALTNRINNELSHLENIFDRSMKPIDIPELPKVASFVLDTIREKDREQYDSLLRSIGEDPEKG